MKTAYVKMVLTVFGGALALCAMKAHATPLQNDISGKKPAQIAIKVAVQQKVIYLD